MGLFKKIDNHLVITSFLLLFSLGVVICRARPARLLDDVYDLVGGDHDEDFHKRQTRRQVGLLELDESDDSEDDDNTRAAGDDTDKKEIRERNAPGQKDEVPMYTDAIPFRRRVSRGKTVVGAHSGEYNDEPLKLENRGAMASEKGEGSPTSGTGGAPAGAKEEGTVKEVGGGKPGSTVHDDDIVSIRESPAHAASKSKPIPAPAKGSSASQKQTVKISPAKTLPSPAQKSPSKSAGKVPAHGAEVSKLEVSLDHGKGHEQLVGKSPAVVGKPGAVNGANVAKPVAVHEPVKSKGQEQLAGQSPAVVGKPKESVHADVPKPVAVQAVKGPEQIVGESPAVIGKVGGSSSVSKPESIWTGSPSGQSQGHDQLVGISPAVLEIPKNAHSTIEVLKPLSSDKGKAQEQVVAESPAVLGKFQKGSIWKTVSEKEPELEPVAADTVKHVDVREPVAEAHPQAEPEEKGVAVADKEPAGPEEVKHVDVRAQGAPEHVLVEVEKPIADVAAAVKAPEPVPEEAKHIDARQPAPVDHVAEENKEKEVVAVKEPEPVPEAKHVDVRQPNIPDHSHLEGEKEEHIAAIKEPEPELKHVHVRQNDAIEHPHDHESDKHVHKQKRSIPDDQEPGKSNENELDSGFHPRRKFGKRSTRRNVRKTHSYSRSKKQIHRI